MRSVFMLLHVTPASVLLIGPTLVPMGENRFRVGQSEIVFGTENDAGFEMHPASGV